MNRLNQVTKNPPKSATFKIVVIDEKQQSSMDREEFFDVIINKSGTNLPDGLQKRNPQF